MRGIIVSPPPKKKKNFFLLDPQLMGGSPTNFMGEYFKFHGGMCPNISRVGIPHFPTVENPGDPSASFPNFLLV